ncbi:MULTISPECIES: chemotaxis response regulator protein-glutamate methylesterase [unclassified Tolypothrix]|uniref:chemotaxis response regulator protein-glutamate methylesterase n=1 Tax=unclassified Tolypothrix TaxID=2649714 RepID=UPI0005EABA3C|nr:MULTISPECIES: chemotaxis response regulator protein-glutamate methylesterase [unclassified Tolypothrix]BAY91199.1 response regulator receiver modulated CheB methylesterase [Microchaete diplosiphon NIES-3275]EKF00022.1 Putative CheB methylesterase [Tolypothrix sp. PCC 7601]MBE9080844.1 chemotaxis response regulator protein-glutamate methylesterase [Tolypothrix sp. LEGE 11397]UYD25282.1 chemotaxis response regulator protein-glutamate methylesterase [Tolypothrix sp. PCC 7712]UYD32478.1 chemota
MRIAIVNDLTIAVTALRRVLQTVPEYQVAWVAHDGKEAVAKCTQDTPDLILMDLLMPVMDGVEATRRIMLDCPCAIFVVTASTEKNITKVYEAMGYGAVDVVDTPADSSDVSKLLTKIARIGKLLKKSATTAKISSLASQQQQNNSRLTAPLVAIGSSTGGPKALADILSKLPANFNSAIAIIQHVDAQFSRGFVEWLNQQSKLPVRLAVAGNRLEVGTVLVAGSNDHLYLKPDLTLGYTKEPVDYPYRPSVDVFFKSLAQNWKRKGIGIVLTGMGRDGAEGLNALRLQGWHTIAQDKASCVVYGMPKAAVELNAAVEVLSPDDIAAKFLI